MLERVLPAGLLRRMPWLETLAGLPEVAVLASFWALAGLVSVQRAGRLGAGWFGWMGPRSRRHRHVLTNLAIAFPDWDEARRQQTARAVWRNVGVQLAEYPHLATLEPGGGHTETIVHDPDAVWRLEGGPIVFVTAHYGNWELVAAAMAKLVGDASVVYSPQRNKLLDRMLQRRRKFSLGVDFLAKDEALRPMLRLLSQGHSVGLVPDQRVDSGQWVDYFGRPAMSTVSPARAALRQGCELVPVRALRLGNGHYRVEVFPAIASPTAGSPRERALAMTESLHRVFEGWIRQDPAQWWCTKRRWPKPGRG